MTALTEQLQSVREALRDMRAADDCADYQINVSQYWPSAAVAFAFPLPHWVIVAGLEAMERELVALSEGTPA